MCRTTVRPRWRQYLGGDGHRVRRVEGDVFDFHGLGIFSQPQPCPQPDFFFGRASRTRKIVRVIATTIAAVVLCQSMLVSEYSAGLEDDERGAVGEATHEEELSGSPFPRSGLPRHHGARWQALQRVDEENQ